LNGLFVFLQQTPPGEEKKWQLKMESLDALLPDTQSPKPQHGDYHELVKVLCKFIAKDTNMMLVALAAQCLTGLARGLRAAGFRQMAGACLPVRSSCHRQGPRGGGRCEGEVPGGAGGQPRAAPAAARPQSSVLT
jgi:hypothetical protein